MEIYHRVSFSSTHVHEDEIQALRLEYSKTQGLGTHYIITVEVAESDPRWPHVERLVQERNGSDFYDTLFTEDEILSAEWVRLVPMIERTYPEPRSNWLTNPENYEQVCSQCGIFLQRGSFRITQKVDLSNDDFFSLYWTHALFCTRQVLNVLNARQIRGLDAWPVIIHETGLVSNEVVQLRSTTTIGPALSSWNELPYDLCPECCARKFLPHMKGVMKINREALISGDIIETAEWFGSGRISYHEILVSRRFAGIVLDQRWRGIKLKPVELV